MHRITPKLREHLSPISPTARPLLPHPAPSPPRRSARALLSPIRQGAVAAIIASMDKPNVAGGSTQNSTTAAETAQGALSLAEQSRARRKGARIPAGVIEAAVAEYRAGASMTDVAAKYAITRGYLYDHAHRAGVKKLLRLANGEAAWDLAPDFVRSLRASTPDDAPALGAVPERETPAGKVQLRLIHPKETWARVKSDYCAGFPAHLCAARYGVNEHTLRDRAKKEGWRRCDRKELPEPLRAAPDPAQIVETDEGAVVSKWGEIAHAAQKPPASLPTGGKWATWLFMGGRGAGKTRAGAEWLAERAAATPRGRFALVGATLHDVREVMIDGPSGLRHLPGREIPVYEPSRRRLYWPSNGAEAYAFSAEEPERLRGPQFMAAWADEYCAWPRGAHTLMLLRMGLRLGPDPRLVVTTTPKPHLRTLRDEPTCVTSVAPTVANAANLSQGFLDGLAALYAGTRFELQELQGLVLDGEGALWKAEQLVAARGPAPAALERIIVAVDPPASTEGVCGIVVAGKAGGRGYVLADESVAAASPLTWARAVCAAAALWDAHEIVAEANQGGDMVRQVLALAEPRCPVRLVHAVLSKRQRAEPVAALYERGRIVHAGDSLTRLEEEMLALGSPEAGRVDRADALVWALTVLLVEAPPSPRIRVL
jgi:phage terminase large subunit-like protein